MPQQYCHNCAIALGIPAAGTTSTFLSNPYQLSKYMKHTVPGTAYPVVSVFSSPGTAQYADYILNTTASGWYFVDDYGRYSMTWYAGVETGAEYRGGSFHLPASGVRVVCYQDTHKIHAYPDATIIPATTCLRCGKPIPYGP